MCVPVICVLFVKYGCVRCAIKLGTGTCNDKR